ncbi:MAG: acyltransferase [Bacteroidales bacterium]|nr:acyltransferase [Bacteroidales bacterium]
MSNPFIHPTAVIDKNAQIGKHTKIWHFSHIMQAKIGDYCTIGQNVFIGDDVIIGNLVKIQNNVSLYKGVECEDYVFLGPSCVFTNVINPRSWIERKDEFKKTLVETGATIGANATIVCGHTIGCYALIGAGCVITKDVPPYSLWVGNPGIQIGWVSESGHRLSFDKGGYAICPEKNQRYYLKNGKVIKTD